MSVRVPCMFVLEPLGLTGRLIHYSTPVRVSPQGCAGSTDGPCHLQSSGTRTPSLPRCTTKELIVPGHHSSAEGDWKEWMFALLGANKWRRVAHKHTCTHTGSGMHIWAGRHTLLTYGKIKGGTAHASGSTVFRFSKHTHKAHLHTGEHANTNRKRNASCTGCYLLEGNWFSPILTLSLVSPRVCVYVHSSICEWGLMRCTLPFCEWMSVYMSSVCFQRSVSPYLFVDSVSWLNILIFPCLNRCDTLLWINCTQWFPFALF